MPRPSSYKKRYASEASKLCLIGATDQILAKHFGVSNQTIRNWKESKPEFLEAIKDAKQKADSEVQKSLFKRATGYKVTQTRTISDEDGKQIKVEKVTRDVAPDPRASRLWLRNRQPEEWRDDNHAQLMQQAKQLQELQQQEDKNKHSIRKLKAELDRAQDAYEELLILFNEQQEIIGKDLLDKIFEVMLEVREENDEVVDYSLNVDRFKTSLISPLAYSTALLKSQEEEAKLHSDPAPLTFF